ncbi:methyltransferase family protein [Alloiococcus sp. CFN-8]|uniref:methyltransferase family protein n=1 Tax=Alloiococcus sp. CFN-8 TaxID=3416081 RepID=UPI003CF1DB29
MKYIILGSLSFIFFYLFDYLNDKGRQSLKIISGLLGLIMMFYGTIGITFLGNVPSEASGLNWLYLILAVLFLLCLIYSLFLELPFTKTYGGSEFHTGLVKTGTYSLCRHPGVLWFFFMYFFYALYLESGIMLMASFIWTFIDVIYVILQEKYFFIKNFSDYGEYQRVTPMLIPNIKSIKKFINRARA